MVDANSYIVDGIVERERISMDIKYRRIGCQEIKSIAADPRIQRAFFGEREQERLPQTAWNADYLDRLSYAVISRVFNLEYLLYLDEVADYVEKSQRKAALQKRVAISLAGIIIIIVLVRLIVWLVAGK